MDEASCVTPIAAAAATLNINGAMHFLTPSYSNSNELWGTQIVCPTSEERVQTEPRLPSTGLELTYAQSSSGDCGSSMWW